MTSNHVNVVVIGAGLSGIGAGYRLQEQCPNKSYVIYEARDAIGGTWDHFRYPGIRSDSTMFSLGYPFKPWAGEKAIADGGDILDYIRETAREYGIDEKIRFNHRVVAAAWSTPDARWTVTVEDIRSGETSETTCDYLYSCGGYYSYAQGYTPEFEGREDFNGEIVHPHDWSDEIDYTGKRVVVIGSGATAITLVPSLAKKAEHVTMLQRSPTYIWSDPAIDPLGKVLKYVLPKRVVSQILRWKDIVITAGSWEISRRWPWIIKTVIVQAAKRRLPKGYDMKHFTPTYDPWDQRICRTPDDEFFRSIRKGETSVVTDRIKRFTESGILLESGEELEADLIVTATGISLNLLREATLTVDGVEPDYSERVLYKGMMIDGVPNLAFAMGYTNASFTLKCDLTNQYVCRLLNHMDENGYDFCVPAAPGPEIERIPAIDFSSGYVQRTIAEMPKQGAIVPWRLFQNYPRDIRMLRHGELEDGVMHFHRAGDRAEPIEELAAA